MTQLKCVCPVPNSTRNYKFIPNPVIALAKTTSSATCITIHNYPHNLVSPPRNTPKGHTRRLPPLLGWYFGLTLRSFYPIHAFFEPKEAMFESGRIIRA